MRREKTMKICANFFVAPGTAIKENAGSDRSWVWQCMDFSEEKSEVSTLAVRFANSESAPLLRSARAPSPACHCSFRLAPLSLLPSPPPFPYPVTSTR